MASRKIYKKFYIHSQAVFVCSFLYRISKKRKDRIKYRAISEGWKNISIFISLILQSIASCCSFQIRIELRNFYFAKRIFARERGDRRDCKTENVWMRIYTFKSSRYRRRNFADKLDQFVRVTFALMYLRSSAFQLTASYTLAWNFRRRDTALHCHTSVAARISQKCHFARCRVSRIALHLPRNYWPPTRDARLQLFCLKIAFVETARFMFGASLHRTKILASVYYCNIFIA